MADTSSSSNVNKDILTKELGLTQLSNTTIFLKQDIFVLSPSVQNQYSWFDLRKVNLDRFNKKTYKGYLLIRYFDKYLLTEFDKFKNKMMPLNKFVENKNIGVHWKFNVEPIGEHYKIINRQDRTLTYNIDEVTVENLKKILSYK